MSTEISDDQQGPQDIEERTLSYATRAVNLFRALQEKEGKAGWIVGNQHLRSAVSIGANVSEARSGESRRDSIHKMQIALKEARERLFQLKLMAFTNPTPSPRTAYQRNRRDHRHNHDHRQKHKT